MINQIRELAVNGQWQEVIELGGALLASDHGLERDDVAWVHLTVAAGHVNVAADSDDLRKALGHAYAGYRCATPGGMRYVSALMRLTSISGNLGHYAQAQWFGRAFLRAAPKYPALEPFIGDVCQDLGAVAMRQQDFGTACHWFNRAVREYSACGDEHEVVRNRLQLVWAYCMAGKLAHARMVMPTSSPESLMHFYYSAQAILAAAGGQWQRAVVLAQRSLDLPRPVYDNIDAADLCMLASRAARRRGAKAEAKTYEYRAKDFTALQGTGLQVVIVLSTEPKGGELFDATATLRGSSDLHDGGCFTTGVA